jgi:hypothetical protein
MDEFELPAVIAKIREDLMRAQEQGAGKGLGFTLEDVELEFQVAVTKEGGGKAGVKFLVINAEASGKYSNAVTQKVKIKLKMYDNRPQPPGEKRPKNPAEISRIGKR